MIPPRSVLRLLTIAIGIVCIQLVDITASGSSNADTVCSDTDEANDRGASASCIVADHHRGRNEEWNWDPTPAATTRHPCTIHRISRSELHRLYGPGGLPNSEYPLPIIIHPDDDIDYNSIFANLTTYTNLPTNFPPNFQVTLSGSDSLSTHRRNAPLQQYLTEITAANNGSGTTLPSQLGNETWYFFGETHSSIWSTFLREHYALPPCQSCASALQNVRRQRQRENIAVSFGIGNIGSGVQWHIHGPGFSETVHGAKHWVLYPPQNEPLYDSNYASRHWMESTYPTLDDWTAEEKENESGRHDEFWQRWKNIRQRQTEEEGEWGHYLSSAQIASDIDTGELGPSKRKPWECTVHEGEIIYFPNLWHHATINLEKYTVFVSSFT